MVDALPSGGSVRKDVLVRIQSWALGCIYRDDIFFWGDVISQKKDVISKIIDSIENPILIKFHRSYLAASTFL